MEKIYDNEEFFYEYSKMLRSHGLEYAGEWYQLKDCFPNLKDSNVLDLGCGYGWHSKECIKRKASHVSAIDSSILMIEKAKNINADSKIDYQVCDLLEYEYPFETFDFVLSNLVLHYIHDLSFVYKKVYQTLKKDGIFLFNIEHPSFTSGVHQEWIMDENKNNVCWPIDDYFIENERETIFLGKKVKKYHHTFTSICNDLIKQGFEILSIIEAKPSNEMKDLPEMKDEFRRPMMLIVKARKK